MKLLALLFFAPLLAWAQYVDFSSAVLLQKGICLIETNEFPCALVEQEGTRYLVVFDRKGESQQWQISTEGKATLLWSRDSI